MALLPVQVTATRARGEPVAVFLRTGHIVKVYVYFKRLKRGRFQLPVIDASRARVEMEPAQLAMLLDGIDLNAKRLVRWKPEKRRGSTQRRRYDPTSTVVPPVDHECVLTSVVLELSTELAFTKEASVQGRQPVHAQAARDSEAAFREQATGARHRAKAAARRHAR